MTVSEVVERFARGRHDGSASNNRLRIEGNRLINYKTVIAFRTSDTIVINSTSYSPTTTRHTNRLRRTATKYIELDEDNIYRLMHHYEED